MPVGIVCNGGPRHAPSEFEPFLVVSGPAPGPQREPPSRRLPGVALRADPNRPAEKFSCLLRNRRFAATWERRRDDLQDRSPSGYDLSLASQAVTVGWADQEIVDLLIAFRGPS